MVGDVDSAFMVRALSLAERGAGRTSPNPIVGAVVVAPGGIIAGQGAHLVAGGPHAEVVALDVAGSAARDATLYVTLEPCCHVGRTGPCVERVVGAGVRRVVVATRDPNPRVAGRGIAYLRAHGVEVVEGVEEAAARRQNAPFFTWVVERRPFVVAKAAVSRDGFVGRHDARIKLTGPAVDRFFHRQRAMVDAIAVGARTVQVDDPLLTARGAYRYRPLTRLIFDWQVRVSASSRVFSTLEAGPVIMVVLADAALARPEGLVRLERAGVIVERRPDRDLKPLLEWLAAREVVTLLVEGGPALHESFEAAGFIDRAQFVVTPKVLGDGVPSWRPGWLDTPPPEWAGLPGATSRRMGEDVLVEFDVHRAG